MDPRTHALADLLCGYCIDAQPRDVVTVHCEPSAQPLAEAVYEELIERGAWPVLEMIPDNCRFAHLDTPYDHHLDEANPWHASGIRKVDARIAIISSTNTRALASIAPARQARAGKTARTLWRKPKNLRWVGTLFPTPAYAQEAGMSLPDFEDFVYGATFADERNPVSAWKALGRKQERLARKLDQVSTVRILAEDTDITLSVGGRTWINSDGKRNMPSGEVFTGPVETSAEGYIRFDFPVVQGGRMIEGVRLVFRKGRVVEATAERNQDYLLTMLDMDSGARRLGELGIGTNFGIDRFIRTILFDEKIGGTVHLAVGNSYPETGGRNRSNLHWDMIKDLRKGGQLLVDGKVIQEDGVFKRGWF